MLVTGANADYAAIFVGNAAEADSVDIEFQALVLAAVVESVVVVAVEGRAHTQAARQFVDLREAVGVATRGFVRHKDIRALTRQSEIIARKNRTAMLSRQSASPQITFAASSSEILGCFECELARWCPYLPAKDPTKTCDSHAGNFYDAAM